MPNAFARRTRTPTANSTNRRDDGTATSGDVCGGFRGGYDCNKTPFLLGKRFMRMPTIQRQPRILPSDDEQGTAPGRAKETITARTTTTRTSVTRATERRRLSRIRRPPSPRVVVICAAFLLLHAVRVPRQGTDAFLPRTNRAAAARPRSDRVLREVKAGRRPVVLRGDVASCLRSRSGVVVSRATRQTFGSKNKSKRRTKSVDSSSNSLHLFGHGSHGVPATTRTAAMALVGIFVQKCQQQYRQQERMAMKRHRAVSKLILGGTGSSDGGGSGRNGRRSRDRGRTRSRSTGSVTGLYSWRSRRRRSPRLRDDYDPDENEEEEEVAASAAAGGGGGADEDEVKSSWLRWMMGGKPRGTNKVVLREAAELGGVPRSDRYSSKDWFHSFLTLPNSDILRDIRSPVVAVTSFATFVSILHEHLLKTSVLTSSNAALRMYIPGAPHSLTMSALGLLLVFRTNSAYQRFAEGRKIWESIVNHSRDLFRMLMLYENEIGIDKRRRVQRLLASFPYFLRHRIRPNLVAMRRLDDEQYTRDPQNTILLYLDSSPRDMDREAAAVAQTEEETGASRRQRRPLFWVDKRTLPWRLLPSPLALEKCARAQNRPLWVCDRMASEIRSVKDSLPEFTNRERLAIISKIDKLSHCIGGAERIHQTVIPLNYARHTLRALTVWLFSLPFAVVKELRLLTGPVLFLVAWLLFGVYEIGVRIEDPFQGTLRLSIMCDTIRRDVLGDENFRNTAFQLETPEYEQSHEDIAQQLDEEEFEEAEDDVQEVAPSTSQEPENEEDQENLVVAASVPPAASDDNGAPGVTTGTAMPASKSLDSSDAYQ